MIDDLGCAPHILHSLIQPHLTSLRLPPVVNTIPLAVKLIVERTHKLNVFELSSCRVRKLINGNQLYYIYLINQLIYRV